EGRNRARALAKWKRRVVKAWKSVAVSEVAVEPAEGELGSARTVRATVTLGPLSPDDVQVQLLHGTVGPNEELHDPLATPMALAGPGDAPGTHRFDGSFTCERAGRYGFTVRVVPAHADLTTYADLGLVTWAQ